MGYPPLSEVGDRLTTRSSSSRYPPRSTTASSSNDRILGPYCSHPAAEETGLPYRNFPKHSPGRIRNSLRGGITPGSATARAGFLSHLATSFHTTGLHSPLDVRHAAQCALVSIFSIRCPGIIALAHLIPPMPASPRTLLLLLPPTPLIFLTIKSITLRSRSFSVFIGTHVGHN